MLHNFRRIECLFLSPLGGACVSNNLISAQHALLGVTYDRPRGPPKQWGVLVCDFVCAGACCWVCQGIHICVCGVCEAAHEICVQLKKIKLHTPGLSCSEVKILYS